MKYTEEHEWLREEDGVMVVGITAHAAEQLGDVVFVELPEVGDTVSKDDEIVVIESVKAASDILAPPLDGEVVEVNEASSTNPARSTRTRRATPGSSNSRFRTPRRWTTTWTKPATKPSSADLTARWADPRIFRKFLVKLF